MDDWVAMHFVDVLLQRASCMLLVKIMLVSLTKLHFWREVMLAKCGHTKELSLVVVIVLSDTVAGDTGGICHFPDIQNKVGLFDSSLGLSVFLW